jgi:hypothetical protein
VALIDSCRRTECSLFEELLRKRPKFPWTPWASIKLGSVISRMSDKGRSLDVHAAPCALDQGSGVVLFPACGSVLLA